MKVGIRQRTFANTYKNRPGNTQAEARVWGVIRDLARSCKGEVPDSQVPGADWIHLKRSRIARRPALRAAGLPGQIMVWDPPPAR